MQFRWVHAPTCGACTARSGWRIDAGRFIVIYDHPDCEDLEAVRIVSA